MAVIVDSVSGILSNADPTKILGLEDVMKALDLKGTGRLVTTLITFYNPHSAAAPFKLRKRVLDETGEERFLTRFDDEIPATDTWPLGTLGGKIVLSHIEHWYELVMDSAPVQPIEYVIDFAVTI